MNGSNWKLRIPALVAVVCTVTACLSLRAMAEDTPGIHLLSRIQSQEKWDTPAPKFQPNVPPVPYETPHPLYLSFLDESGDEQKSDALLDESLDINSLAKRLDELESNYSDLSSDHDSLQEEYDDLKKILKYHAQAGHKKATMKVNGRIHVDHWAFPGDSPEENAFESGDPTISPQDRIGFRRLRFGVKGDL